MSLLLQQDLEGYSLEEKMYFSLTQFRTLLWGIPLIIWAMGFALYIIAVMYEMVILIYFSMAIMALVIVFRIIGYKNKKKIRGILNDYIEKNYFRTFETLKPIGSNPIEKFLSLAVDVFPPLKQKLIKFGENVNWKNFEITLKDDYKIDFAIKTNDGILYIKYFDVVKFEDIVKLVKTIQKKKKNVLRIICLAKKFDELILTDEFEKKMQESFPMPSFKRFLSAYQNFPNSLRRGKRKAKFKLDVIAERKNGYSIVSLGSYF